VKRILRRSLLVLFIFLLASCGESTIDDTDNVKDNIDDVNPPVLDEKETFTIRFISNGGTSTQTQVVVDGEGIVYPNNPTRDGYVFVQWHTSANFGSPFNRTEAITEDVTLYAEWQEISIDDVVIRFESDYGETIAPLIGKPGDLITQPSNPTDVFYDFVEWQIKGTSTVFDFTIIPEENLTLEAVWEKNDTYELTFYLNQSNTYESLVFTSGDTITLPNDPEIEGYVFTGWYRDTTYNNEFNVASSLPSEHINVYGRFILIDDYFYTISFDTDGGNVIDSQIRITGEKVLEPNTPIKKGYIFQGWYEEDSFQTPYDFNEIQTDDLILYAKWMFNDSFTITNLIVSDDQVITIVLDQGESVDLPQVFQDGYIFDWWYVNENYQVRYRDYLYYAQPLGYELNLYAKWIEAPNVVYITLETNGGSEGRFTKGDGIVMTGTIQANPNDEYTIYNPSREGFDFAGWYTDEGFTNMVNPIMMGTSTKTISIPSEDATLYAKWVSKTTGEVDDGTTYTNPTVIEKLEQLDFVCDDTTCVLEEYQDYNYIFDLETNTLSYVIDVDQVSDDGYRYYDRVLTINQDYDVDYSYIVEEDYGFLYYIEITVEGNYLTGNYTVTNFDSNVTQEQTNYDKAIEFIENIVNLYERIMN
jgi:uncharacterized repeat protein (TIGR02543 family)